jgi:hypothetical protein
VGACIILSQNGQWMYKQYIKPREPPESNWCLTAHADRAYQYIGCYTPQITKESQIWYIKKK